ncbi:MAG: hypothetical protein HQL35_03320, partial [Alphaproteobacteria bacterium]|nr:hypothetical protein [Alphaproteobacteria bacterium]
SFVLVRAAWVLMAVTIMVGAAAALAPERFRLPTLFGFFLIFGWLLTFVAGILQRILPFLVSMHAHALERRAPRLADMGHADVTLTTHAVCHAAALALVAGAIAFDVADLVLAGAVLGGLGAAAFLWFTLELSWILASMHRNENTADNA